MVCSFCGRDSKRMPNLKMVHADGTNNSICIICARKIIKVLDGGFQEQGETPETAKKPARTQGRIIRPAELKKRLDEYVIGQERAKMELSVAVYNHMKRLLRKDDDVEIEKSNILMIGPTGSGKTYLAKTLARILDVPFVAADATAITQTGYVGEDAEDIIRKLYTAADGDVKRAQQGIVFIDEIDKIAKRVSRLESNPAGEGAQQCLLKILEGTQVNVSKKMPFPVAGPSEVMVDTSNILFICGGAFEALTGYHPETKKNSIGFGSQEDPIQARQKKVTLQDLVSYGMLPEFLGRTPIITQLSPLDEDALMRILTEPKNALIKQYRKLFELDGVRAEFTNDALRAIAKEAITRNVGARGLRSIVERTVKPSMYYLPDIREARRIVFSVDSVSTGTPLIYGEENKRIRQKKERFLMDE